MPTNIGKPIPTYNIYIRRASDFGFVIHWWSDEELVVPQDDINGRDFVVYVGERQDPLKTWTAVAAGNTTSFHLSVDDSDLPFDLYDGMVVMSPGPSELVLANAKIYVQPS